MCSNPVCPYCGKHTVKAYHIPWDKTAKHAYACFSCRAYVKSNSNGDVLGAIENIHLFRLKLKISLAYPEKVELACLSLFGEPSIHWLREEQCKELLDLLSGERVHV